MYKKRKVRLSSKESVRGRNPEIQEAFKRYYSSSLDRALAI